MKLIIYALGATILSLTVGFDFSVLRGLEVFGACLLLLAIVGH